MKNYLLAVLLLITTLCYSQTSETKYYKSQFRGKEVSLEMAKFSETTTHYPDGTETSELRDIKNNEIIRSHSHRGNEPVGKWINKSNKRNNELDYSFNLVYTDSICPESPLIPQIKDYFSNDETIKYQAPKFSSGDKSITQYFVNNYIFPFKAEEGGISGRVVLIFTITEDGTTENIMVKGDANVLLAKEAVRMFRGMRFSTPPMLNGQPQRLCITYPLMLKSN